MFYEEFEVVEVNEIHGIYFCPGPGDVEGGR